MHSNQNNLFLISKIDNQPQFYFIEYLKFKLIDSKAIVISNNNLEETPNKYHFKAVLFINSIIKQKKEIQFNNIFINDLTSQFLNFIHSTYYFYKFVKKNNLYNHNIFSENLKLTLISFLLKKICMINKISFFNGDILPRNIYNSYFQKGYKPIRMIKNFLFIKITFFIKYICLKFSQVIIYSSKKVYNWDLKNFQINIDSKFHLIPNPNNFKLSKKFSLIRKKSLNIIYFGNLNINNGIEQIIDLSVMLKNNNHKFCITIVGGSSQLIDTYSKKILKLGLSKDFIFKGRVDNLFNMQTTKNQSFGIAPYFFDDTDIESYVDNGKINDYLSLCLPIITTNYAFRSEVITSHNLGFVSNDLNNIFNYLINIDSKTYDNLIRNILKYNSVNDYKVFLNDHQEIFY